MPSIHQYAGRGKHVLNRGTFERRTTSDVEKSVAVLEAPFAVALGDVQWDRPGDTKPLVTGVAVDAIEQVGVAER